MLYNGERIGDGSPPEVDIAVDPLEGTELCANGLPNSLAVIALSERGTMFDPGPCVYMSKMATSRDLAHLLDFDRPLGETLELIAKEKGTAVGDVVVIMLDRPRHAEAVEEIRAAGARIRFIPHGDVSASLIAVTEGSPVDLLWGIGGTPEGVLSAAAIKCIGGQDHRPAVAAQRRGAPGRPRRRLRPGPSAGHRPTWCPARTCSSPPPASPTETCSRACTSRAREGATTESLVMRSRSGTVRKVHARPRPGQAARDHRRARRLAGPTRPSPPPARRSPGPTGARERPPRTAPDPGAPASGGTCGSRSRGSAAG